MKLQLTHLVSIAFLYCTFLQGISYSQEWVLQNPRPQFSGLRSIQFANPKTGWLIGNHGAVVVTTNGGENWVVQNTGTDEFISGISFVNSNNGWAVGNEGLILQTNDGGITWIEQPPITPYQYVCVKFVDKNNGWAIDAVGTVIHTTNGGSLWKFQRQESNNDRYDRNKYNDMEFINKNEGWIIGGNSRIGINSREIYPGLILHTTDGGTTWNEQNSGVTQMLTGMAFSSAKSAWITCTNGILLHSTNSGETWKSQIIDSAKTLTCISFLDPKNGWMLSSATTTNRGSFNYIYRTSDGGASWIRNCFLDEDKQLHDTIPPYRDFYMSGFGLTDIAFRDLNNGWVIASNGIVYRTRDGGITWNIDIFPMRDAIKNVVFTDTRKGWTVGGGNILHTTDGGLSWKSQIRNSDMYSEQISFPDDNYGWVVGYELLRKNRTVGGGNMIIHTTNGGVDWNRQNSRLGYLTLYGVSFVNKKLGWIVGEKCTVIHTGDGGNSWQKQRLEIPPSQIVDTTNANSPNADLVKTNISKLPPMLRQGWSNLSFALFDVAFIDSVNGWIVGGSVTNRLSVIFHTTNGGGKWTYQNNATNDVLKRVIFLDSKNGWVLADSGRILHTTNSGESWHIQTVGMPVFLSGLYFVDLKEGWVVGFSTKSKPVQNERNESTGIILHTTDGGENWSDQTGNIRGRLSDVYFNNYDGWIVGDGGTILHYSSKHE